jgi:hypothetical protein
VGRPAGCLELVDQLVEVQGGRLPLLVVSSVGLRSG